MMYISIIFLLLVIEASPIFCKNEGIFDKIKEGFHRVQNYLKTAKDIADLVSGSLNKKIIQRQGDKNESIPKRTSILSPFISAFLRLFGLDSQKITAIAVNSVIFLAQLIGTLFDITPSIENGSSEETNDLPDPYKFIMDIKSGKIQDLVKRAQEETLPKQLIESIDGMNVPCVKLLICKVGPIILAAQKTLKPGYRISKDEITSWLPSKGDFEENSEVCEQNYSECLLFPDSK